VTEFIACSVVDETTREETGALVVLVEAAVVVPLRGGGEGEEELTPVGGFTATVCEG